MRNLIFIALIMIAAICNAQRLIPITVTASEADTSNGAETDYISIPNVGHFEGVYDIDIQVLCTLLGGAGVTGSITLEKSADGTSYTPMLTTVDTDFIAVNDTFTIADAATMHFRFKTYWAYYRLKIAGTADDTTLITTKYSFVR